MEQLMMIKTGALLLGLLLCLIAVEAKHISDQQGNIEDELKRTNNGAERHRRKRYHINYGYDYTPPSNPFYTPYRREYDRNQPDLLPEIYRLLDEISAYIRRPPQPPPQPIYIPYAVPYPVCNCESNTNTTPNKQGKPIVPSITNRLPEMDDSNQNWGLVADDTSDDDGDGARPLNFTPIGPKRPLLRPPAAFEHGTMTGRVPTTEAPPVPSMCDVVSLSCCSGNPTQQKQCFINNGCTDSYDDGKGCKQERLLKIIDLYSRAYAPVN